MASSDSKQIQVLRFIHDYQSKNGFPPTIREIGEAVGLSSSSTIHGHIARLIKNGYLEKKGEGTKARAIEVTPAGFEILGISATSGKIPVLGLVTAGQPILAVEQEATEFFPIPENLIPYDGDLFMLNVRGESMINIGILDGDKVIVRRQQNADNGDIVVAMNEDNEATVKRFFQEGGHYRLQPENDTMAPIILESVFILGKVVSLYRDAIY
ncbi:MULTISPECIES: transcriptional repressor LexA [Fructobacillus]|jgi:repressor LexA|uniref:LexA repressor n=1 Tax=Fructobacillus cardui TaxID=2893170 RepID=A0ABM9MS93_9LACO|nr:MULTISPECIES: transcriptional repressor LexA [Fructobacillus]KMK54019.1 LexA repressor [Fructobacillus sp. EFB-N1]MCK8627131.1 transcriptional repressor LexA [Fructobacillus cardui]CAK1225296.1 SOS-response transcriptional repressor LexA (RecA-mediated autopeptidase) (LexA) [Fructobacillus cardui]CAK1233257.1 SOS-response transcriptional repressor LexA (RecA-mediated autopeptidase) (LexA) [Fructobacillus cardui]CAK1236410.1 SOS-response transcriptional repressor LexA (RecA-mediated autopept